MVEKAYNSIKVLAIVLFVLFCSTTAQALSIISDEETEVFLHRTIRPIFTAAKTSFSPNRIFVVNDNTLNAFVADGNNMFVNTGTIIGADSQNEIAGVLAHETGHIEGGHIFRHKMTAQQVQTATLVSMIAGGLAGLAAGRPDVGMAAIWGSQSTAMNSMLAYQVSEERSADEAAVKLLAKVDQSPAGMLNFMKKIQKNNRLQGLQEFSYYRTHPVTTERIAFLSKAADESKSPSKGKNEDDFLRVKAKLFAFIEEPAATFIKYPLTNTTIPAQYAHAIAYFKQMKMQQAMSKIDALIEEEPHNPYFRELKAQMLFETGKVADSVVAYRQVLKMQPRSSLFKMNLAQAMLENHPTPVEQKEIINLCNQILINSPDSYAWVLLARAHGLREDAANYNYASAEYSLRVGDFALAKRQAESALKNNPNSSLKLKLEDLLLRIKDLEKENRPRRN